MEGWLLADLDRSCPAADSACRGPTPSGCPRLLLLLDGVPYRSIRTLYDRGRFRNFRPPARLISVFPTLTDPAYDLLFGTGPTPGFEAGYFDRSSNRVTGAFRSYLTGRNEAWVRHADYRLSFIKDAVMYLLPRWVYRGELRRARRILRRRLASGQPRVVLYILSTDGLAHMLLPAQLERELARLDDWIGRLVHEHDGQLEVVVISDHGLSCLPPNCSRLRRFDLVAALRAAGLRPARRLKRPGDVAVPLFGLLDMARIHAFDAHTARLAVAALRTCPEVELVILKGYECLEVYAGAASAVVCHQASDQLGPSYSYQPVIGDPLELAEACATLRAAGQMNSDGFASRQAWLAATAELPFPAGPQRLWEGIFCLCREQPDIVISLKNGWFVGSGLLSRFVRLKGTHGGPHRRASETFAMATGLDLPSPLDLHDLGELLRQEAGWGVGIAPGTARTCQAGDKALRSGEFGMPLK